MMDRERVGEDTGASQAWMWRDPSAGSMEVSEPVNGGASAGACGICRLSHAHSPDAPSAAAWTALGRLLAMPALLLIIMLGILQRFGASDLLSAAVALSLLGVVGTFARRRERRRRADDAPAHD